MFIIFICNFLIIYKTKREDSIRIKMQVITRKKSLSQKIPFESRISVASMLPNHLDSDFEKTMRKNCVSRNSFYPQDVTERSKPFYLNVNDVINKVKQKANNSNSIIRMLLIISFSFALLNLPYLIAWMWFYINQAFYEENISEKENLFAYLQICEIFYILKYATHFYINYASSSVFREQLKYICKIF